MEVDSENVELEAIHLSPKISSKSDAANPSLNQVDEEDSVFELPEIQREDSSDEHHFSSQSACDETET